MGKYKEPNYRHISRFERVVANDALNILASIEMQGKDVSDPIEYNKLYDEELELGYQVMSSAFKNTNSDEHLKFTGDSEGDFIDISGNGDVTFFFQHIELKVTDFCIWALKKGYDLPVELAKLVAPSGGEIKQVERQQKDDVKSEVVVEQKTVEAGENSPQPKAKKNTNSTGYLTEVVKIVHDKILELGKPGLLKPSKIREFIIFMKEMANKKGPYADEDVLERIKSIEIPEEGDCTIITQDKIKLRGQTETIVRGSSYTNNGVAKRLTKLRKNNSNIS